MPAEHASTPTGSRSVAPEARFGPTEPQREQNSEIEIAWFERSAAGDASGSVPLVLLHGFTGHRDDFAGVVPRLAGRRRVLVPDLRGHGDSGKPDEESAYSFAALLDDLEQWLDARGIERCDLLGHSMGGMLALRFALTRPERIRRLVLMSTGPAVPGSLSSDSLDKASAIAEEHGMGRLQELTEAVGRGDPEPAPKRLGEAYWVHHRRRLNAMTPTSYRALGRVLLESESLVPRLGQVAMPTLVLVGDEDTPWLEGADQIESGVPGARRVTIPHAGHHPHQENSELWHETLEGFLSA